VSPPTNRPTPQFTRHHDIAAPQVDATAFRQGWRVTARLDGLLEAGRIDREQWDGAQQWRRWAELIGLSHVQRWDVRPDAPCHPDDLPMLRRVQAASRLRSVAEALGPLRVRLLTMCVSEDRSWREIGDRLGIDGKTARAWCAAAVVALAAYLAGEPVPEAPALRPRIQPGSW
jgi:DNA-directed RNA polymerase specialized sigma24 family protein